MQKKVTTPAKSASSSTTAAAPGISNNPATTLTAPSSTGLGNYTPAVTTGTTATTGTHIPTYTAEFVKPDIQTTAYIANQVSQQLQGRDATAEEIAKYHEQFTKYAATHPTFTRQAIYDTSGTSGLSPYTPMRDITAQKTPLPEKDFISNIVYQGADSKAYQAATGYMGAMNTAMQQFGGAL
jgi:hypothetical protein